MVVNVMVKRCENCYQ